MTTTIEGICKRREIIPRVMPDLIRHPGGEKLETTLVVEAASSRDHLISRLEAAPTGGGIRAN